MRPIDLVLILLGILIIILAGFGPLFGGHDRQERIRQECAMFYGPNGPAAVAHCVTEMTEQAGNPAR